MNIIRKKIISLNKPIYNVLKTLGIVHLINKAIKETYMYECMAELYWKIIYSSDGLLTRKTTFRIKKIGELEQTKAGKDINIISSKNCLIKGGSNLIRKNRDIYIKDDVNLDNEVLPEEKKGKVSINKKFITIFKRFGNLNKILKFNS
jgi:hypothetical protein